MLQLDTVKVLLWQKWDNVAQLSNKDSKLHVDLVSCLVPYLCFGWIVLDRLIIIY